MRDSCFLARKAEFRHSQVLSQIYTAIQMKTGYWSSLLMADLFDRQQTLLVIIWNSCISIGRLIGQGALLLDQLSLQILVELIKLAMLIQFTQPVIYICQAGLGSLL